jgi:hypothetical protein
MANNLTLLNLCNQYKIYLAESIHPPRYDIISPYVPISKTNPNLLFTKEQLDMRRKVEILNYSGNNQNSKTNNPTRSEIWSFLNNQTSHSKICRNNPFVKTPTTASDVPGPPMDLFLDPTVPLYNYISNRDRIADFSSSVTVNDWEYYLNNDIECNKNELTTGFDILYDSTKQGRTTYRFQTPISINLQGTKNIYSGPFFTSVREIEVRLTNVICKPFFGDFPVISLGENTVQNPNFNFKVLLPTAGGDFLATKYIGDLTVSNIILFTQYQYVYKIKLSFDIVVTLYDSIGNIITGQSDTIIYANQVIINLIDENDEYYHNTFNCAFVDPNVPAFVPFNITSDPPNRPNSIPYGDLEG